MTLHRFFVDPEALAGDRFPLPAGITHQVTRVLRLRNGDELLLLDGLGGEVQARLEGGNCVVVARGTAAGEATHQLTVWQALLRGDHLEPVIRHGTELGIAGFNLFVSDRCVARDLSPRRLERLQAVAREAAEQSERGIVPPVAAPVPYAEALAVAAPGSVLLFERHDGKRLTEVGPPPSAFIGPEGGFSLAEVEEAERAGMTIAGLGPRILRSETVGVAACAVILSRTGDFA
ncbi:MAG: 16S rRNA (uracil(1498)-N(3))-methyltransferase [Chloroflexota bacterium]|nr:16S rRNA (uracil(1498)-N(3))-methyltransferase [Chloroflexota bacterium]